MRLPLGGPVYCGAISVAGTAATLASVGLDVGIRRVEGVVALAVRLARLEVSAMGDRVCHVFTGRSPAQIAKPVVGMDSIPMESAESRWARPDESLQHELVDSAGALRTGSMQAYRGVARRIRGSLQDQPRYAIWTALGPDPSSIRDGIQSLVANHGAPLLYDGFHRHQPCRSCSRSVSADAGVPLRTNSLPTAAAA